MVSRCLLFAYKKAKRPRKTSYREFIKGVYLKPRDALSESDDFDHQTEVIEGRSAVDDWVLLSIPHKPFKGTRGTPVRTYQQPDIAVTTAIGTSRETYTRVESRVESLEHLTDSTTCVGLPVRSTSTPEIDAFTQELLKFAQIPTPTPPPSADDTSVRNHLITIMETRKSPLTTLTRNNSGRRSPHSNLPAASELVSAPSQPDNKSVQRTLTGPWPTVKGNPTLTLYSTGNGRRSRTISPNKKPQTTGRKVPASTNKGAEKAGSTTREHKNRTQPYMDNPPYPAQMQGQPQMPSQTRGNNQTETATIIEISDSEDFEVIGTTTRRHMSRRRTVLTIRSRSLSEAVVISP